MEKRKGLPMELVMEILLKIPTRALLRFSCVSKRWHNLILEDENFGDIHSQRPPRDFNPIYLFLYHQQVLDDDTHQHKQVNICMSISNSLIHNVIRIYHHPPLEPRLFPYDCSTTCNGLLCLTPSLDVRKDSILLCNPITAEYLKLPPLNNNKFVNYHVALGFVPLSKQYKVVCLLSNGNWKSYIWVHTLGVDTSWREIQMNVEQHFEAYSPSMLYLDSKIYYLVQKTKPGLQFKKTVLVFDVESETATLPDHTKFPNHLRAGKNDKLVNLPSCCGKGVSLFTIRREESTAFVDVWVLKEDYKWDLQHKINLPHIRSIKRRWIVSVSELADGDILIFLNDNFMVRYNQLDGKITGPTEQLPELGLYTNKRAWCVCDGYNSSLVSLKKYGSAQTERLSSSDDKFLPPTPRIQLPPNLRN